MSRNTPVAEKSHSDSLRAHADELLELAETGIDHGLARGQPMEPDLDAVSPRLREQRAAFVTLRRDGDLRGCIGSLEARRPLALDVAINAFGAAFRDPRFPPLEAAERDAVACKIEVLSVPEPLSFTTEAGLLDQLVPGRDGLLLEAGSRKGTFLPTVWDQLPEPEAFWRHLKRKANLPADYFDPAMRVHRYTTEILP
ncbi:AmmeMemoRadiSam system protein A [Thiohalorhabdus sp.]|uniref:AmmeMemoRadiSam system protein A n=1 Tax=Thiohalorhabdus sp. TaxID=3094134 RepID=UPI002FC2837C